MGLWPQEVRVRKASFVWLSRRWDEDVVLRLHRWVDRLELVSRWLEDFAGLTEAEWDKELYGDV